MIAKFEKRISKTSSKKYRNLNNLLHWHEETEIVIILSGSAEINVNGKMFCLEKGMCAFFKSGDAHCIKGTTDSVIHVIKILSDAVEDIVGVKRLKEPVFIQTDVIKKLFAKTDEELKSGKEFCEIVADCMVRCLIAEVFRNGELLTEEKKNEEYKELLVWISKNYAHISFKDGAEFMNFSKPYFSKYFQHLTGFKFTDYMNILKVSAAAEKIISGEKNMTEVSIGCGFSTIRNFNRVFKKLTGYPPKSLPENYNSPHIIAYGEDVGFDPTLKCSEIIK